jgi:hypothetical protein
MFLLNLDVCIFFILQTNTKCEIYEYYNSCFLALSFSDGFCGSETTGFVIFWISFLKQFGASSGHQKSRISQTHG